jgi:hypothetical protein
MINSFFARGPIPVTEIARLFAADCVGATPPRTLEDLRDRFYTMLEKALPDEFDPHAEDVDPLLDEAVRWAYDNFCEEVTYLDAEIPF